MRWRQADADDPVAPAARVEHLVTTEAASELLVYDERCHHIHHLNAVSATVWRRCDGVQTVAGIARETGYGHETVRLALAKLAEADLLAAEVPRELTVDSHSRRRLLKKAGIAAIPAIVSVTAPLASAHASEGDPVCLESGSCAEVPCCPGFECRFGFCFAA